MNKKKAAEKIVKLFIRLSNKYQALEKIPIDYGVGENLYHSERHLIDQIGDNPDLNITQLAKHVGVTKGAISQVVKKLENKHLVRRHKRGENEKEIFLEFTHIGTEIYRKHKKVHEQSISPLEKELGNHTAEEVQFLVEMFQWFDTFLDDARQEMERHGRRGHK